MVSVKLGVAAFAGLKTSNRPVMKVQVPAAAVLQPEVKVMPVSLNLWADPTRLTKKLPAFKPSEPFTLPIEPPAKLPVLRGNGGMVLANAAVDKARARSVSIIIRPLVFLILILILLRQVELSEVCRVSTLFVCGGAPQFFPQYWAVSAVGLPKS
jgi:hypothetical protein